MISFSVMCFGTTWLLSDPVEAHFGCPTVANITGNANDNYLEGDGASNSSHDHQDNISGQGGRDAIFGYSCNDALLGNEDSDHIHGAFGADIIWGGGGDDLNSMCSTVTGKCAELVGGADNDFANGQDGSDLVLGDTGSDSDEMRGGSGHNDFVVTLDGDSSDLNAGDDGSNPAAAQVRRHLP
ncbi:MAG: calcium-binding protein [Actinomycetota bacterium]